MAKKAATNRVRLQSFLSDAGVASRRRSEEWIEEGRVLVNDEVVETLPVFIDPKKDRVIVDGTPVRLEPPVYYVLNKPKSVVCTNRDPAGRMRAIDLLPPQAPRLFVVGRLDVESTGLLLMTNDGELAQRITHPRHGVAKVYRVDVKGQLPGDITTQLKRGVYLAEGRARASEVEVVHRSRQSSVMLITLREGRNRQLRRMLASLGFPVKRLERVQIGPLAMKDLPVGACRKLRPEEVRRLKSELEKPSDQQAAPIRKRRRTPSIDRDEARDEKKPAGKPAKTSRTRPAGRSKAKRPAAEPAKAAPARRKTTEQAPGRRRRVVE